MQFTEQIMGMPVTLNFAHAKDTTHAKDVFKFFKYVDAKYSTYKSDSEISRINNGLAKSHWSPEMRQIFKMCEQTKQQTGGYFNISRGKKRDPSGLVKGWAIQRAAQMLLGRGVSDFYVDAGGDLQTHGRNKNGNPWHLGIRNPFKNGEIIKVLSLSGQAVATSGTYIRGQHVYNPHNPGEPLKDVMSLTVVGSNIYDADRFATAAFAMGKQGVTFIDSLPGLEAYMVDSQGIATLTRGFERFVV